MTNPLPVYRQKTRRLPSFSPHPENKIDIESPDIQSKQHFLYKVRILYWGLIPFFFFVLILALHHILPEEPVPELVFNSQLLILVLNIIFVFLSSLVIAYLAGLTFLKKGELNLLLLGAGALMLGLTNSVSSFLVGPENVNHVVTVHNSGVLFAGTLHFASTTLASSEVRIGEQFRKLHLSAAYVFVILSLILFCLFSQKMIPSFFIKEIGFTSLRQMVLGSAVLLFAASGFNLFGIYHRDRNAFSGFYAIALLLFATGLLGVFLQRVMGDPIGWLGRLAQCLGGFFFFIAVLKAHKTASLKRSHIDEVLSASFSQVRELYKSLIETTSDAVIVVNQEKRILLWNSAAEKMFGYTINETIGRLVQTFSIIADDEDFFTERFPSPESKKHVEFTANKKNGDIFNAEASVSKTMIAGKEGYTFIIRDITERKQAEKTLQNALSRAEEERRILEAMMEYIPMGITIAEAPDVKIRIVSRSGRELTGKPAEVLQGISVEKHAKSFDIFHSDGITPANNEELPLTRAIQNGEVVREEEWVLGRSDGTRFPVLCTAAPIRDSQGNITGGVIGWQDITERKRSEDALAASEKNYRELVETANSIILRLDSRGVIRFVNDFGLRFFGYSAEELTGREVSILVPEIEEGSGRDLRSRVRDVIANPSNYRNMTNENVTKNGGSVWVSWSNKAVLDERGNLREILSVGNDLTSLMNADKALRKSEERLRALSEASSEILYSMSPDWSEMRQLRGGGFLAGTDSPSRHWLEDYIHPEDRPQVISAINEAVEKKSVFELEHRVRRKDGSWGWTLSRAVPILDAEGEISEWFGSASDFTERKRAEEELKRVNENLERLVAERTKLAENRANMLQALAVELIEAEERERRRIAHLLHEDLQQVLAAANFQLQTVIWGEPKASGLSAAKKLLEESIEKSRRLSYDLSPPVLHHLDFSESLRWLANGMRERFGLRVELEANAKENLDVPLKAFLFRSVQELLFNVVKHTETDSAKVELLASEDGLVLSVSDRGRGFDLEILNRPEKKGAWGLLAIKERADYVGGSLAVESTPGKGSRFVVKIPCNVSEKPRRPEFAADHEAAVFPELSDAEGTDLRVLFADDHKVMRQGLVRLVCSNPGIELAGEAENGREAVEKAKLLRPDVILMDVSMPEMDGVEATRRIKAEMPGIRVVGLSMYDDKKMSETMREAGAESFLSKTASPAELLKAIYGKG
jgi:PAS domain S-box-containing protein